ncbi:MAG: hypothetical protein C0P77_008010 [Thermoanaerobacterales bacterium]|nr:hypothetical protein [Thermoanaerobacterales bacterium]
MDAAPGTQRDLADGWRAAEADEHLRRSYTDHDFDDDDWQEVRVPGHWRSSPAFAGSDGPVLHRCRFEAPPPPAGRRAWLTFEGIFYQGDVWLDGGYLGDTEGYFVPHTFEVTDALRARSEHALAVEVTCPAQPAAPRRALTGAFQAAPWLDPAWNPGGIWRPVRLHETGPVRIAALRVVCAEATSERAVLRWHAVLDSDDARRVRLRTEVGGVDHEVDQPLAAGDNEVRWTVTIERPVLWWPRALGDPALHDVRVAVLLAPGDGPGDGAPDEAAGPGGARAAVVSDERRLRTGLRSVQLRRWVARVNGERLFLKGALLGPTRQALGEAPGDEVRRDVERAVDAGLDLLRVHGHVARPELYEAADERGLLLWQDMPLVGPYLRGIRRQAARQARAMVDLLGHHPSIALWCGHDAPTADPAAVPDEPTGAGADALRRLAGQQLPTWNRTVLDGSVRRALHKADGSRPVVPHSGVAPHLPQLEGTDTHLSLGWLVGDERDLPDLARRLPRLVRFVTEPGPESLPSGDSAGFAAPERWPDLDWEGLERRHGLHRALLARRVPPDGYATFDGWRDATQRYQATVVRRHVEELRRLKYRPTGGFAVGLLADARPAVSPALLDHHRRPKAAYEALRDACRPVIVVADRLPATVPAGTPLALDVHVVSDLRVPIEGARVTAELSWPGGRHAWHWAGDVGPDECVRVGTVQAVAPALDESTAGTLALDLRLRLPGGELVTNRYEARLT